MALLGAYGALRWHGWLHMEVGDLVMFFFLANLFFDPVQVIGNQLNQALMAMAGAERLFRMLDQKPEWQDAADGQTVAGHQRPRGIPGGAFRVSARAGRCSGTFPSWPSRDRRWRWWGTPAAARRRWWRCCKNFICRRAGACWWTAWI